MITRTTRLTLAIAVLAACGSTTETSPSQLNLDRPVDIAFACYGGLRLTNGQPATAAQEVTIGAQPISGCDIRSLPHTDPDPLPVPVGQEQIEGGTPVLGVSYYGFILQSSQGTVAIAQWAPKPAFSFAGGEVHVLDADPLTPGKNAISVGEDPIAIVTDTAGCKEITANAGSCDLSVLDINSALDELPDVTVARVDVKNAAGQPIRAKPAAMVAQPQVTAIGQACAPTTDTSPGSTGIVYIAYPSCHLVAAVDVSTGTIVANIDFATGAPVLTLDGDVTCPDECGGGGAITTGPRPVAIDLEVDRGDTTNRRLVIGADNYDTLTIIELDQNDRPKLPVVPAALKTIVLQHPDNDPTKPIGVTALAISPVIGMGGSSGAINDETSSGGKAQYIYAVATDNTVRVADILAINKECDTQVDPRLIHDVRSVKSMSCFTVGDPTTPARRVGARGPGVQLIGAAVPTSVEIVRADPLAGDGDRPSPYPEKVIGYFAIVTAANGATFVVNIDDDDHEDLALSTNPLAAPLPLSIAHQLRDGIHQRGLLAESTPTGSAVPKPICQTNGPDPDASTGNLGGPRVASDPTRNVPSGTIAAEKVSGLPDLHHLTCTSEIDSSRPVSELGFAAPVATRDLAFPDLRSLRGDEDWTLTWEGSLSNDGTDVAVDGPGVREAQIFVDQNGMRIADATRPFCDAGVEPYDIVQLRGCDPSLGNGDCPIGYECYVHPNSQVSGLGACILADEADRLANACEQYLTSLRRYTVRRAASGSLQLLPRKRVLRTTPIDGCHDDAQCKSLADYGAGNAKSTNQQDTNETDPHTYSCAVDPDRQPRTGYDATPLRTCIMTCEADDQCAAGTVCANHVCMEGVIPPQSCVNAPQRFEVRGHDAFTVVGTLSGYIHPIIADAGGNCVRDITASPLQIGRIPLDAPLCDPAADPRTGKKLDGTFDANPCKTAVMESDVEPKYGAACVAADPATALVERPATGIRFRSPGMTYTLVDPTYPGDVCTGDRKGTLVNVPLVFTGYQLAFRQTAGFQAMILPITPSFPIKVVRGPGQSIWVVDEGDFLSTSVASPSTRGKVFRVEASVLSAVNTLQ